MPTTMEDHCHSPDEGYCNRKNSDDGYDCSNDECTCGSDEELSQNYSSQSDTTESLFDSVVYLHDGPDYGVISKADFAEDEVDEEDLGQSGILRHALIDQLDEQFRPSYPFRNRSKAEGESGTGIMKPFMDDDESDGYIAELEELDDMGEVDEVDVDLRQINIYTALSIILFLLGTLIWAYDVSVSANKGLTLQSFSSERRHLVKAQVANAHKRLGCVEYFNQIDTQRLLSTGGISPLEQPEPTPGPLPWKDNACAAIQQISTATNKVAKTLPASLPQALNNPRRRLRWLSFVAGLNPTLSLAYHRLTSNPSRWAIITHEKILQRHIQEFISTANELENTMIGLLYRVI